MSGEDQLTTVLRGRKLGHAGADTEGRTALRLIDGGALHVRNSSLIETAGSTGGLIDRVERTENRLTLVFSNGHSIPIPLAVGPGAVAVYGPDGALQYED